MEAHSSRHFFMSGQCSYSYSSYSLLLAQIHNPDNSWTQPLLWLSWCWWWWLLLLAILLLSMICCPQPIGHGSVSWLILSHESLFQRSPALVFITVAFSYAIIITTPNDPICKWPKRSNCLIVVIFLFCFYIFAQVVIHLLISCSLFVDIAKFYIRTWSDQMEYE